MTWHDFMMEQFQRLLFHQTLSSASLALQFALGTFFQARATNLVAQTSSLQTKPRTAGRYKNFAVMLVTDLFQRIRAWNKYASD